MADPESPLDQLGKNWYEHLGLITAIGAALFVIAKLLLIADFDANTALAVLQSQGSATVTVGSFLTAVPDLLVTVVAFGVAYLVYIREQVSPEHRFSPILPGLFGLCTLAFLTILPQLGLILIFWLAAYLLGRKKRGRIPGQMLVLGLITFLLFGIFTSPPWMPSEVVELNDGRTIQGYVLTSAGEAWAILTEERRVIWIEGESAVEKRSLCSTEEGILSRTVADIVRGKPSKYPSCASLGPPEGEEDD